MKAWVYSFSEVCSDSKEVDHEFQKGLMHILLCSQTVRRWAKGSTQDVGLNPLVEGYEHNKRIHQELKRGCLWLVLLITTQTESKETRSSTEDLFAPFCLTMYENRRTQTGSSTENLCAQVVNTVAHKHRDHVKEVSGTKQTEPAFRIHFGSYFSVSPLLFWFLSPYSLKL